MPAHKASRGVGSASSSPHPPAARRTRLRPVRRRLRRLCCPRGFLALILTDGSLQRALDVLLPVAFALPDIRGVATGGGDSVGRSEESRVGNEWVSKW